MDQLRTAKARSTAILGINSARQTISHKLLGVGSGLFRLSYKVIYRSPIPGVEMSEFMGASETRRPRVDGKTR